MRTKARNAVTHSLAILVLGVVVITWMLAGCKFVGCKGAVSADLVVLGKIFTSEGNQIVEAFAVKDGKYKASANVFVPYYRQGNMAAMARLSPEDLKAALAAFPNRTSLRHSTITSQTSTAEGHSFSQAIPRVRSC